MTYQKKIGLLGGTFDPIHNGHLHIAEQALNQLQLDEIWFIPNAQSPQRNKPKYAAQDRYKMCGLATKDLANFKLCDLEMNDSQNYTIDTLKKLQIQYPSTEFYLILGMDAYLNFESWHEWQEILKRVKLIVVNRPGFEAPKKAANVKFITVPPLDVSASAIRKNPQEHKTDMPAAVWDYLNSL